MTIIITISIIDAQRRVGQGHYSPDSHPNLNYIHYKP